MKSESSKQTTPVSSGNPRLSDLAALFDGHIAKEFADHDVNATMKTMVAEPYVHCVPIMTGGFGGQAVRSFYSDHFINQIPKDAQVTLISRTIGKDQVVDELIMSFTHDTQWHYLFPGIPPTGKHVELPHVVVMKFEDGKVAHEHIWWHQASLLVQVGLLDPGNLPVVGVEQARTLLRVAEEDRKEIQVSMNGLQRAEYFQGQLHFIMKQTTRNQVSVLKQVNLWICFPPLEEQRRIVAYLDDLQEKMDALKSFQNETSKELDALMPSLLDQAFRGKL